MSMMLSKPLCTIFSNNYIRIFNSAITRTLTTKYGERSNLPIPSKTNLIGESTKRFAGQQGTPTSSAGRFARQEPGPVRLGFIPDEWFTFFFPKTGVSGLGTFTFTFSIFLMSKEYYVLEHEYYGGLSMAILCVLGVKYVGPIIAQYLDREVDEYEKAWADLTINNKKVAEDSIKNEEKLQWSCEGQLMLIEAKRENVALQLEAAYRKRLMYAYVETKKRLEYCTQREEVEKAIIKRHMTSWVVKEVSKSVTEEIQKDALNKCMDDLAKLSKTFEGLTAPYPEDLKKDDFPPTKPKK